MDAVSRIVDMIAAGASPSWCRSAATAETYGEEPAGAAVQLRGGTAGQQANRPSGQPANYPCPSVRTGAPARNASMSSTACPKYRP